MLQQWFDAPKYKGLSNEQATQVDQLLDFMSQVVQIMALQGRHATRGSLLKRMLRSGMGDPAIVASAFILTHSALAPLLKDDTQSKLTLNNRDLAVFFPFTFRDLSEDEQQRWLDLYAATGRTQAPFGLGSEFGIPQ